MMKISDSLRPACVAISGGCGDIGMAIARMFSAQGARVALCDLAEPATALADNTRFFTTDVTDPDAAETFFDRVTDEFGDCPNIVIPNAAIVTAKSYFQLSPGEWKRELDVNLNGAYYFAQAAARRMVEKQRTGRIIFMGSWAGHSPHRQLPAYSVSKAGLRMLTKTLALELADRGILVNEIAPGFVDAGLSRRIFDADPERRELARQQVPVHDLVASDDVALQVMHLCSNAGKHITGSVILMDGGLTLTNSPLW